MTSQEKILREEIDEVLKDHDGVYLTEGEKRYITLMEGNTTDRIIHLLSHLLAEARREERGRIVQEIKNVAAVALMNAWDKIQQSQGNNDDPNDMAQTMMRVHQGFVNASTVEMWQAICKKIDSLTNSQK